MLKRRVLFVIFRGVGKDELKGYWFVGSDYKGEVSSRHLDFDDESLWNPGMTVQESFTYRSANARPNTLALREWKKLNTTDEVISELVKSLERYKAEHPGQRFKTPKIKKVSPVDAIILRNRARANSFVSNRNLFFTSP